MTLPTDPESERYMILQDDDGSFRWMREGDHGTYIEFPPMDDPWYETTNVAQ